MSELLEATAQEVVGSPPPLVESRDSPPASSPLKVVVGDPALLWVDLETTGLMAPEEGDVLEIGLRITDAKLQTVAETSWIVFFDRARLGEIGDWALKQHSASGLLFDCFRSNMRITDCDTEASNWYAGRLGGLKLPLAGSSVHFDRAWMRHYLPLLERCSHYRNFDVSTVKQAARLWVPGLVEFYARDLHRVIPDIQDSIDELRYYQRSGVIVGPTSLYLTSPP